MIRMRNRMRRFVWWPRLTVDVEEYIRNCPTCNAIKGMRTPSQQSGRLDKTTVFRMVSMDHVGPRTIYGKKWWILAMMDHHTRYMVAVAVTSTTAEATKKCFREHWVAKFGAPECVHSDRGPAFTGDAFRLFVTEELGCKRSFSSTEYPQGNGMIESAHRAMETAIMTSDGKVTRNGASRRRWTLQHCCTT